MKLDELIIILKRIYREYVENILKKSFSLILSIFVAGSTSSIAWLRSSSKKFLLNKINFLTMVIPF